MHSRWDDADAGRCATPLDMRVYSSRLLGGDPSLVLHGGGNTSVKTSVPDLFGDAEEILYIKGSGWDLASITAAGFAPVRLAVLRKMADLPSLADTSMVRGQRAAMIDPDAPTPSVEAILHAIIPFAFVDHTHADAIVTISNTPGGAAKIREIFGDTVLVVPYVMPGFVLARAVRELTRGIDWDRLDGIVLLHHGVFTFGHDAKSSYERMIALVTRAEAYLAGPASVGAVRPDNAGGSLAHAELLSLAQLRQAAGRAKGAPVLACLDHSSAAVEFSRRTDLAAIATRGPLTPDHVIRTKPVPLVADGDWGAAVAAFGERYREYFARHASAGLACLDPAPRWVLWTGRGSVAIGSSARDAGIITDIARHTRRAIEAAERLGGWRALPEADLFAVEYWELEQAKLKQPGAALPFAGKVALVTGAAGGIGRAVALALHQQGAAVVGSDISPEVERLTKDGMVGIVADARDQDAVRRSVAECVSRFGGLDIVVSNAGVFPPSQMIDQIGGQAWDDSLALNLSSHLAVLQNGIPFLRLGFDPCVVFVGSKNVPAPGPGAAAYSVAKAGLAQLARVAALELGRDGIRVNTVHPHLVLDTGLWTADVLAARAAHYGMTADAYRKNNVLSVEISTRDVANAVLALAGAAFAKTTGSQIAIDGGSDRVI